MHRRAEWTARLGIALIGALLLLVLSPAMSRAMSPALGIAGDCMHCATPTHSHCAAMSPEAMASESQGQKPGLACAGATAGCPVGDCAGALFAWCSTVAAPVPTGSLPIRHAELRRDIAGTAPSFDPPPPRLLA